MNESFLQPDVQAILYVVFGVLGGIGGIEAFHRLIVSIQHKEGKLEWKDVDKGTKELVKKIRERCFTPDYIVSLGRGGAILGGLLSGNLGVIPLFSLDRKYDWKNGTRTVTIFGTIEEKHISGKNILLVQAFPYTGDTIKDAKKFLEDKGANQIMTASLIKSETSTFIPDFYVFSIKKVTREPWRIFPEYKQDSKSP